MKRTKSSRLFSFTQIPFEQVYRFRVILQGSTPPIWRLIEVPGCYDFWNLHCAIQDAMGWQDRHLHHFRIVNPKTGLKVRMVLDDEETEPRTPDLCYGWEELLADYFTDDNKTAEYEYDFGAGWKHEVVLEGVYPRFAGVAYPRCLAGQRACPPEDCGGVHGYDELLQALKDPKHPEHKGMKRWVGKGFDPDWFHPGEVHFTDPQSRWEKAFLGDLGGQL